MSEAPQEKHDKQNIAGKDDSNQQSAPPDSLELPEAIRQQPEEPDDRESVVHLSQSVSFQGPVPPPELLKEYQSIDPDFPVALTGVFVYGRYMEGKETPESKHPTDADNDTE